LFAGLRLKNRQVIGFPWTDKLEKAIFYAMTEPRKMKTTYTERGDIAGRVLRIGAFFFIALGAAVFYYLIVNMKSFIAHNPKKLELYYKQAKRFSPEQKSVFLKNHAGFWVYQACFMTGGVPLKKIDLLEFKDNGIIWEVVEWDVRMPSGKTMAYFQIRTGYVEPYGTLNNDTLGDAYTIHQSFITGKDTCFGGWNFLDLWSIRLEGGSLVICKRKYEPYKGAVADFFPHGMLDLVGMGAGGGNKFLKKTGSGPVGARIELKTTVPGVKRVASDSVLVNAMALPDCLAMNSLSDVLKKELFGEYAVHAVTPFTLDSALVYVERYYQPLFIDEQLRLFPRPLPSAVTVSFTIKNDGEVENVHCTAPRDIDKMLQNELQREVQSWRFMPMGSSLAVTYTFAMP
jgi:hypothetical protein